MMMLEANGRKWGAEPKEIEQNGLLVGKVCA